MGEVGCSPSEQANLDRRERLRKLALETVDLNKDPYFMKNHLGSYECKLCLTLHNTEGNYLAHTQGKRHQQNLARRALKMRAMRLSYQPRPKYVEKRHAIKIGRPGYKVTKSGMRRPASARCSLRSIIPKRIRRCSRAAGFMSAYEQRVEPPDKNYQYLLFACEPYETIGFKVPNDAVDKGEDRFFTNWDVGKKFTYLSCSSRTKICGRLRRRLVRGAGSTGRTCATTPTKNLGTRGDARVDDGVAIGGCARGDPCAG